MMKEYEAKVIAPNGAEARFEFCADDNELAAHHLDHVVFFGGDLQVDTLKRKIFEWNRKPVFTGGDTLVRFRRQGTSLWRQLEGWMSR